MTRCIAVLALVAVMAGCALHRPPVVAVPDPAGAREYLIVKLTAADDDYICVETSVYIDRWKGKRFCMSVRELRIILSSIAGRP